MAKKSSKTIVNSSVQTSSGTTSSTTTIIPPSRVQKINVGSSVNAKDGDSIRAAFIKVNGNFDQFDALYTGLDSALIDVTASVATMQEKLATAGIRKTYHFSNALRWFVRHNMNTKSFTETLTDINGERFFAKIKILDENSFVVDLTSATSGAIDVYFSTSG